jgi:hypothetical protein
MDIWKFFRNLRIQLPFCTESGIRQFVYLSLFFSSLRVLTLFFLSFFRNVVILREAHISLVFMFLGLSLSPSISFSICLFLRLSVSPSVCFSFCLFLRLSVSSSVCFSVYLFLRLYVSPSICFSV